MILITGATGKLGLSVVEQLKKHLSNKDFIVTSSQQEGVDLLGSKGLNSRLANFNDQETLNIAFKGIKKLLLISTMDNNRFEQHKNVIDAAKNQGVNHIIYTSLAIKDIQTSGVKDLMISHYQTEDYIKESRLAYTILRNTMYADALPLILGPKGFVKNIDLPGGTGRVPYALRREMGEATANLLVQTGHENVIYEFTGSKLLDYDDLTKEMQKISGISITYNDISKEEFTNSLKEIGLTDFETYLHSGTIEDIKNHQYEIQSGVLENLLGRPTLGPQKLLKEVFYFNKD